MTALVERLKSLENDKLIDVAKNYRQYGYSEELRDHAITLLRERGENLDELRSLGALENHEYDRAEELISSFHRNSILALVAYLFAATFWIVVRMEDVGGTRSTFAIAYVVALLICVVFFIKSFLDQTDFYRTIGRAEDVESPWGYFLVGLPFYFISYFYFKKRMNEAMRLIQ